MPDRFGPQPGGRSSPAAVSQYAPPSVDLEQGRRGYLYHDFASDDDQNTVPAEFASYIGIILWRQGVDVTRTSTDLLMQLEKELWQDPYLHDMYLNAYQNTLSADPITQAPLTDANFETAIKQELFSPTQTHSQFLVSQGIQLLQLSGKPLTSDQQTYGANLGGGNPAVLNAIARAAQDTGVPYNVALAVAVAESGLNPTAVGDNGCSHGLFQLNTCGGEGQGMSAADLADPYTNARTALRQFAAVAAQDPGVTNDPGAWAAAAQRPKDPTGYASRVNNLLQSGFGGAPSSLVPKPFDQSLPITEDHSDGDPGIDYGTGATGSIPMYTPFAGTIRVEDQGKNAWGKRVKVVLDNGYTFAIGHLHSFSVSDGQRVNPGDILGMSGGDPSDPSSGITTGPHVEVQWISPGGKFLDPHIVMDPIMTGTATFRSLNLTGAEGSGVSATAAHDRALGIDPILEQKYPEALKGFQKYFGRHPTASELQSLVAQTGGDPSAVEAYLSRQPSHVPGVSMGVYNDVKGNLDSTSQKLFGHAGTDQMVQELVTQGLTTPSEIQYWLTEQSIKGKMDPKTYQALYQLNTSYMQGLANQSGSDPRIIQNQYQQMQSQDLVDHDIQGAAAALPRNDPSIVARLGAKAPGFGGGGADDPSIAARLGSGAPGFRDG